MKRSKAKELKTTKDLYPLKKEDLYFFKGGTYDNPPDADPKDEIIK